jgi:hypothetical protein
MALIIASIIAIVLAVLLIIVLFRHNKLNKSNILFFYIIMLFVICGILGIVFPLYILK